MRVVYGVWFLLVAAARFVGAVLFAGAWPRSPLRWLAAGRAMVGPTIAAMHLEERPYDAARWAEWTVENAERAGGMAWQIEVAIRIGIEAMVQENDLPRAIDWSVPRAADPAAGWAQLIETVRKVRGPGPIPGLVVRARTSMPDDDPGGLAVLMANAAEAHAARGNRDAAASWRAEILDLARTTERWTPGQVGRVARVFRGDAPEIVDRLESALDESPGPDASGWYRLVRGLLANGMVDRALDAVTRSEAAAALRPLDPATWLAPVVVGEVLLDTGRLDESAHMGRLASERADRCELPTGIETANVLYGRALHALGRNGEARVVLERAIAAADEVPDDDSWLTLTTGIVFPDGPPVRRLVQAAGWFTFGRVLEALGERPEPAFERARRLASSHALLDGGSAADWILDGLAGRPSMGRRRTTVTCEDPGVR